MPAGSNHSHGAKLQTTTETSRIRQGADRSLWLSCPLDAAAAGMLADSRAVSPHDTIRGEAHLNVACPLLIKDIPALIKVEVYQPSLNRPCCILPLPIELSSDSQVDAARRCCQGRLTLCLPGLEDHA
jgi:hypothetical protein